MRQLKAPRPPFVSGTRESAAHMTEKLTANQFLGCCATVKSDERTIALIIAVNGTREELLADTRFPLYQHRHTARAHLLSSFCRSVHGTAVPDELSERTSIWCYQG